MKKLLLCALFFSSLAHAGNFTATGKVKLGKKVLNVTASCKAAGLMKDNFVTLGTETYSIGGNCNQIDGRYTVQVNGETRLQKSLFMTLDKTFLKEVKRDKGALKQVFNVTDAELAVIDCPKESNAFILVGNDTKNEIAMNCATLAFK